MQSFVSVPYSQSQTLGINGLVCGGGSRNNLARKYFQFDLRISDYSKSYICNMVVDMAAKRSGNKPQDAILPKEKDGNYFCCPSLLSYCFPND